MTATTSPVQAKQPRTRSRPNIKGSILSEPTTGRSGQRCLDALARSWLAVAVVVALVFILVEGQKGGTIKFAYLLELQFRSLSDVGVGIEGGHDAATDC